MCVAIAHSPWDVSQEHFPSSLPIQEQLKFLLQYAILAPSTKNTQPWRFSIGEDTIGIFADLSRWQPVADRGRRELYISLGCALENLLVAGEEFGFRADVSYFPQLTSQELAATVAFHPGGTPSPFRAGISLANIPARRTEHGLYSDQPVTEEARRRLLFSCGEPALRLELTGDPGLRSRLIELNLHADQAEFSDSEFRVELGYWVGQGVFGTPRLVSRLAQFILSRLNLGRAVGRRNAAMLMSAPLVGLISARTDDPLSHLRAGQALERLWLHATDMGIALQPMSQALEVPSLRAELTRVIGERGWIPQQVFRVGYPRHPAGVHTPRRLLDDVLVG